MAFGILSTIALDTIMRHVSKQMERYFAAAIQIADFPSSTVTAALAEMTLTLVEVLDVLRLVDSRVIFCLAALLASLDHKDDLVLVVPSASLHSCMLDFYFSKILVSAA